jgi:two-component system chemotaxis sensor kinase CheA
MTDGDLGFDEDFLATLMGEFLDESQTYLSQLNDNLLDLDEYVQAASHGTTPDVDEDKLNEMFRAAHSLKGLSAMLALEDINQLTHRMENVLDAARRRELGVTRAVVDVVFQAVDRLTSMIDLLKDGQRGEVEYRSVVDAIEQILGARHKDPGLDADATSPWSDEDPFVTSSANTSDIAALHEQELLADFDQIQDEAEVADKYVAIFVDEAGRCLDEMSDLLAGERTVREMDELLRICHQIKGSAAAAGFLRCAKLTHLMEDRLQDHREADQDLGVELVDAMLRCTDALRAYVDQLRNGQNQTHPFPVLARDLVLADRSSTRSPDDERQLERIDSRPDNADSTLCDELPWRHLAAQFHSSLVESDLTQGTMYLGIAQFDEDVQLAGLKAELFLQRLKKFACLLQSNPALPVLQHDLPISAIEFAIRTEVESEKLQQSLQLEGVKSVSLLAYHKPASSPIGTATTRPNPLPAKSSSPAEATVERTEIARQSADPRGDELAEAADDEPSAVRTSLAAGGRDVAESTQSRNKPTETIRVDIDRLDQLMNLTGQLVINKARFGRLGDRLKTLTNVKQAVHSLSSVFNLFDRMISDLQIEEQCAGSGGQELLLHLREARTALEVVRRDVDSMSQARATVNELAEAVHQLDRVSEGIQKSVMDTRMLPIGPLFGRFKRVIRDVTRVNGKDVRLLIHGEKTELDKRMIDEIGDPLIHMIRNAADHGIELPEEREAVGKPRYGTVTLNAFHRGNGILIQISDDGRGIDAERVRAKAIANGLITEADAERMTTSQIYQLIWEPGFSTAEKVTEVSGRGVGMDIVRSKIEELNGSVELDSEFGCGTTFTIKLPLTMAILPSLLAEISGDVFAVPVESVVEIVRVEHSELATVHGVLTASIRGRVISVVDLRHLFQWYDRISDEERDSMERRTLVIIGADHREVGVIVHGLLGEEDIVIKSLAENFRSVDGIAGASILGDGRVSLILDVNAVLELACRQATRHPVTIPATPTNAVTVPPLADLPTPMALTATVS